MSKTNTDTVVIRAPDGPEIRWRRQRLLSLGADADLAETIAASNVDVHDIARLIKAGCPLALAWSITQPVEEPTASMSDADAGSGSALT
jgi:hypothetical protein